MIIRNVFLSKKVLVSLSAIAVVAAIVIGGTMAYFSDTETSTGNKFTAGKLNLKINSTCEYNGKICANGVWGNTQEPCTCTWAEKDLNGELFFNLNDVKPGDNGKDMISLHVINNDSWMCAQIANLKNFDNNCEQPEIQIDTTCGNPGEGEGELQNYLNLTLWKDNGAGANACNNILDAGEQIFVNDQPISSNLWALADSSTGNGPFIGDETYCVGASWNVPIATGNIIQTDSVTADMRFIAVQARHMENFKCSDLVENGDPADQDGDGILDTQDNCQEMSNPNQINTDGDAYGDACDIDDDNDGEVDPSDSDVLNPRICSDYDVDTCDDCSQNPTSASSLNQPAAWPVYTPSTAVDGPDSDGDGICSPLCVPTTEVCDMKDNDCDGITDEGLGGGACDGADSDSCNEGTLTCTQGALQCSDVTGDTVEVCDGADNDCDGTNDNGLPMNTYYPDADGDTWGGPSSILFCNQPGGYVARNNDCDDLRGSVYPGANEVCDGRDNDCDGAVDDNAASSCAAKANAAASCSSGTCQYSCTSQIFGNCNSNMIADGCEVNLYTDARNCGRCGGVCPGTANGAATCNSGSCGISCNNGYTNCTNSCVDTQTDESNCGACGQTCAAGKTCTAGKCE